MSKELKALSRIKKDEFYVLSHYEYNDDSESFEPVYEKTNGLSRTECFKIVKQALIKEQEQEKVLSIIREIVTKTEDKLQDILRCKDYEEYKELWYFEIELTEEEFELLKRYFNE